MEYVIVKSGGYPHDGSPHELQRTVESFIAKGWKPCGGVAVFQESTGGGMHTHYFQAMTREKKLTLLQRIFGSKK